MGAAPLKTFISQEDYLVAERLATEKHEYFEGEVFAMSGASFGFYNTILNVVPLSTLAGASLRLYLF